MGPGLGQDIKALAVGFRTSVDQFCFPPSSQIRAMAAWMNERVGPRDFVIAEPVFSWMLRSGSAPLVQVAAREGYGSDFFPAGIPVSKFALDCRPEAASYLIIEDYSRGWTFSQNGVLETLYKMAGENGWSVVKAEGPYQVLANPAKVPSAPRSPPNPDLGYQLGESLYKSGQRERALRMWRRVMERHPDHGPTLRALAGIGDN
jgi:hypothetical protein